MRIGSAHLLLTTALGLSMAACSGDEGGLDAGGVDGGAIACTTDDDCPADQYCEDATSFCAPGTGDECADTSECGDGRVCNTEVTDCGATRCRNVCEPASCTGPNECGAWVCIDGACAEPPSCDGVACPGDLICNDANLCEEPTACADDTECTSPQICAGGICREPSTCRDSTQCPSGLVCQSGVCDDPCSMDADCGDATMFTCDTGTGICRQRCFEDGNCPNEQICESLVCVAAECTVDSDCTGAMEECQGEEMGHGRCVVVFACMGDDDCPDNFTCENMTCVELPACLTDRDCGAGAYCEDRHCQPAEACNNGSCAAGFDCVGDICVPAVCRGNLDCPNMGEVCIAGECVAATAPTAVTDIRILTPAGTVHFTDSYAFTAVALDATGDIVPGVAITWNSSDEAIATIDAAGLATALMQAGQTDIVASVDTGMMTVASTAVPLTVIAAPMAGFQVAVTDGRTGQALAGVTVVCNAETATTDAAGLAGFDATVPKTCSAFDAGHDYLTVFDLTGTEAHLALPPTSRVGQATGYTGMVDTSFATNPVKLSFTGGSFASPLFAFTPGNLFGGDVFSFEVPVVGSVAFPAGATASAEFMGFPLDLKSTYYARTPQGLRRAWTFAGGAEIADLGITGGGNLLENILPLFQTFKHGGSSGLETLIDLPFIADSADINGNGDTTEMVPDYNAFVPKNLTPSRDQNLRFLVEGTGVSLPANTNAVMLVGGSVLPGVGFVPLGLDGLAQPPTIGRFTSSMTAPYDGLEAGSYAVLVAAVNIVADSLPETSSARLFTGATLPSTIDLTGGFMDLPAASFDNGTRDLMVPAVTGGDAWHATFSGANGGWQAYGPSGSTTATLPAVPMGLEDRSQAGGLVLVMLDLAAGQDFGGLFAVGVGPEQLNARVGGFSQQRVR